MKLNFKKIIGGAIVSILIVGIFAHFRAYTYVESELKQMADNALHIENSRFTSCEELRFLKQYKSKSYKEVVVFEWVCLNRTKDEYLITVTVESDGYVNTSRIALSKDELSELNNAVTPMP